MRNPQIDSRRPVRTLCAVLCIAACEYSSAPYEMPGEPTLLVAASPTLFSATVGSAITDLPSVIAQDPNGNPVAGATVTFRVVGYIGRIQGETAVSNSAGIARLGAWTISTITGNNTVVAQAGGSEVQFTVHGLAGAAAILANAGGDQVIHPDNASRALPRSRVTDKYGNGVSGVHVTFAIATGEGTITDAVATSLADGIASPGGLELRGLGYHRVVASSPALPPVTFTILMIEPSDPACGEARQVLPALPVQSVLGAQSCRTPLGRTYDTYGIEVGNPSAALVKLASASFDAHLELFTVNGLPVAEGNDLPGSTNSVIRAFLPSGRFIAAATSAVPGSGNYEISTTESAPANQDCTVAFVVAGIDVDGAMPSGVCDDSTLVHRYRIYLGAGTTLNATLRDLSYTDWYLELLDSNGRIVTNGVNERAYEYSLRHANAASGYYTLTVYSGEHESRYRLSIR